MESEFIDWLTQRLPPLSGLDIGIGDDAAVIDISSSDRLVVTTDLLVDGVHFAWQTVEPQQVGHKAVAVNLSDLAAMAARPIALVVAVAIPDDVEIEALQAMIEGMLTLAERFDTPIVGGDTNRTEGPLTISITAMGTTLPKGPLTRAGAVPGDWVLVTGEFGGSILGRHLDFIPRVHEAIALHERYTLHAGIDVSDGLTLDLSRLAARSECGAELDLERIPIAAAAVQLAQQENDQQSPLQHALSDGEDFELLLAVPPSEAQKMLSAQPLDVPLSHIGSIVAQPGLWQLDASGRRQPLPPRGYEH